MLPFYITAADADSVIEPKRFALIGTRFDNMLFGYYWHGGAALINRPAKADTTIAYRTIIPTVENLIWTLTTTGPTRLTVNGYWSATTAAGKKYMNLVLKGTKVYLSSGTDAIYPITPDGESSFNNTKLLQERKLILKYKFTNTVSGYTYHCTDTLTFRNRIRDGINEWQDENPSHYTK
jgi:hypothetical protein